MITNRITITRIRPGHLDRTGARLPESRLQIEGVTFEPGDSTVDTDRRTEVTADATLYVENTVPDVQALDVIETTGPFPGTGRWQVIEKPAVWVSPWHPDTSETVIRIRSHEG